MARNLADVSPEEGGIASPSVQPQRTGPGVRAFKKDYEGFQDPFSGRRPPSRSRRTEFSQGVDWSARFVSSPGTRTLPWSAV